MKIFISNDLPLAVKSKYIYFDNDFISELFYDETILKEMLGIFRKNPLIIDPLTKFEFLRSVFIPQQINFKKVFIEKGPFMPATNHQQIFATLQDNALLLSKIYAHQDSGKGSKRYSFVDLFLAARIMFQYKIALLITGNKKDFPSYIFEVEATVNIEQNDGIIKPYSILRFNNEKFEKCNEELKNLENITNKK